MFPFYLPLFAFSCGLVFYCLFPFFVWFVYHPSFPPFFFTFVLSLFFGSCRFYLWPTLTCLGLKDMVVVAIVRLGGMDDQATLLLRWACTTRLQMGL
jgi:hypothetical protein